jgi:hypothetical protein
MNRFRAIATLAVLLAATSLAHAQAPEQPAVMLGAPVPHLPEPPKLGVPTTTPVTQVGSPAAPQPTAVVQAPPAPAQPARAPQPSPVTVPPAMVSPGPVLVPAGPAGLGADAPVYSAWLRADYLMLWARGAPTGGPLVTTGVLGTPGTQVLLGDRPMGYGPFSGLQITAGLPIGNGLTFEPGFFYLGHRTFGFSAGSNASGVPLIARPVIDAQDGTQQAYAVSFPGNLKGVVGVESQLRMDGYEFNLGTNVAQSRSLRFDVLGGFRALDMSERLAIHDHLAALTDGFLFFNGIPLPAGSRQSDFDTFATSNHFYGGQVGGRLGWQSGAFSVNGVAKVALGVTQQLVDIAGGSERFVPNTSPQTATGGILAQVTNIGHYYRSTLSVVPQAGLEVGYQITPRLRATVGYTLIYWTHVARPGNQTDRTVNPALVPTDLSFGAGGGPARPALPSVRESDLWVQGVNFGLLFAF